MNAIWHFVFMILASFILFFIVIRIVLGKDEFISKRFLIILLSVIVVIAGMLFGKFGANWGLP